MSVFICSVCGHIEFTKIPETCPVCKSAKEEYSQNDYIFEESAAKSREAATKHIPIVIVNKTCDLIPDQSCIDIVVRIGAAIHPMEKVHYIQFIDCYLDDNYVSRVFLTPGVFAAGNFHLKTSGASVTIIENCNVHGYWKTEVHL
jgi:desulfoferrodoxin-like iron-binding protein